MITGQLRNDIDRLWETFWTGGLTNPLTVIEQITYLLFIKRMDDLQTAKEKKANRLGQTIEDPIYTPEEQHLRWSDFKDKDPEEMFRRFTQQREDSLTVFEKMKEMGGAASAFRDFMKGATFMIPTARLLDKAVQELDKIDRTDQDTKGDLYEYLLSKLATAGTNGQFRTPRHIIQLMVDMVAPTPQDTICDPSAGSMGFLVTCLEYLREHHADDQFDEAFKKHLASGLINGLEMDPGMIRIGAMNLMLHGAETPNLRRVDSLSEGAADIKDAYSLILANPPFKGSLDYDAVDATILKTVKSKKTELLFLGLILRMLQVGGRAAVIVPDGVLFGSSKAHQQIRRTIVEDHQLQAVISMPSGVFKPYAGVSTAILFFTRTDSGGTDHVWFYDMQADGYSLDDKRSPLGEDHEHNNLPDILQRWQALSPSLEREGRGGSRTSQSFLVPKAEIAENDYDLSINRYKEIVYEPVDYDPPATILQRIAELDQERTALQTELEQLLRDAENLGV